MKQATVAEVKHPRYTHRVRYTGPGGKTLQRWFKNETDALAFAKDTDKETGIEGKAFGKLGADEKAVIEFWRNFVSESSDAAPPPLIDVVREYADRWKATRTSVTVQQAFDRFIATKEAEGLRRLSVDGLRTRCGRFARDFAERPICTITTTEVSDWVLGLVDTRVPKQKGKAPAEVSLLTKKNYRRDVATMFSFAKSRGWLSDNPMENAAKPKPPKKRPGVLSPEDVKHFFEALGACAPELVPFWAVRFFAGVREQETLRMDWAMVDLDAGEIHLPETITKTGVDRTISIRPALEAFLQPLAKPSGPLCDATVTARRYALKKTIKAIDAAAQKRAKGKKFQPFSMPKNAARHSFATFHLLAFRHPGETSLQLGHGGSPELLHRHYRGISSEKEAKAFWSIRPSKPKNVTSIRERKSA
ncbi:hypothetical protein HAHE_37510 [Haloferula helveola]|uniref:Tyr recombinase domain-containing protein n=1 Tax=Haloferula helveola TaxID=490095 RepID=A0ABM7RJT1_9BACT|nr:hypothetical protein HAHE_37510 [Haloferula helveola]